MPENIELVETISIITNKLNPLHKKEIRPLDDLIDSKKLEKELPKDITINLRGTELDPNEFKNAELVNDVEGEFLLNQNYGINTFVRSIIKIDETSLAIAGDNGVYLYDILKKVVYFFLETSGSINSICIIDANTIAFGGDAKKVTLFDIKSKEVLYEQETFGEIYSICVIDANTIAFGGDDKQVTLFNIESREVVYEQKTSSKIFYICSIDVNIIAFGGQDKKIILFDVKNRIFYMQKISDSVASMYSIDNNIIILGGWNKKVTLFDVKNRKILHEQKTSIMITSICQIDSNIIAFLGTGKVILFDVENREILYEQKILDGADFSCQIDSNTIAFGGFDSIVNFFDIKSKQITQEIQSFDDAICSCYDFKEKNLTLSTTTKFTPNNDPLLYRHAWYVNKETNKLEPYFKFPDRFEFDEKEPNKIILK